MERKKKKELTNSLCSSLKVFLNCQTVQQGTSYTYDCFVWRNNQIPESFGIDKDIVLLMDAMCGQMKCIWKSKSHEVDQTFEDVSASAGSVKLGMPTKTHKQTTGELCYT